MMGRWLGLLLKRAQHSSGGVHPHIWGRSELPPLRSGVTAEFAKFCIWLESVDLDANAVGRASAATAFLRSKMLANGALPYEMTARTTAPVQECPYLAFDSMLAALAGQACSDEELVGRSLDFLVWSYRQLPRGKFLPMWYNFEAPRSKIPDDWVHQPTCHQAMIVQLELDDFLRDTWDGAEDDFAAVLALAEPNGIGLFDADRYRLGTPLLPHFIVCESILKCGPDRDKAATAAGKAIDLLLDGDGVGDTAFADGHLSGIAQFRVLAAAVRVGLLANVVLGKEFMSMEKLASLMHFILSRMPEKETLPIGEEGLTCVGGCMAAFQASWLFDTAKAGGLDICHFRILA